nr:restriction endonuclease subunit S [Pseudomonas sp. P818]
MEVRPGYKQTEVGVIPEDWDVSTVGHEFDVQLGKMLDTSKNTGDPKPYLGNRNVQWGRIEVTDLPLMRMSRSDMERFRLKRGDLLVCEGGEVGRAAIWNNFIEECYYQKALHRLRPSRGFDCRLMVALLHHWSNSGVFSNYVTQTSIAHLPREKFLEVPLPVPKPEEQGAIAAAFSDMDALLDGLDRLIAKKRAIKQATMQQLLTGQSRLPGFSGEWEVKRLGDHLSFLKNGVNSRAELSYSEDVRYLHYGDIHGSSRVMLNPNSIEMPCLPRAKASHLDRLQDGDLIYADASEDIDGIGKSVEVQNVSGVELVAGLHTIAIRFDKNVLADGFKAYIQFIPKFRTHLRQLAAGTKVYATNRAHIASAELRLPGVDEQRAISALLTDMDTEITTLEARHTKTRALKQAMMQELLTGRTRLV